MHSEIVCKITCIAFCFSCTLLLQLCFPPCNISVALILSSEMMWNIHRLSRISTSMLFSFLVFISGAAVFKKIFFESYSITVELQPWHC